MSSSSTCRRAFRVVLPALLGGALLASTPAGAAPVVVTVTVENRAAANSVSFAPLHLGFHSGVFDSFDNGAVGGAGIVSIAEGGAGGTWQSDFAAADPGATRGVIPGVLLPGQSRSLSFTVDPSINPFFSFGSMVVPSNDLFIANDSPTALRLLDAAGRLLISSVDQRAADIWDAGSEVANPANAAFVLGGNNDLRTPENDVVSFDFSELGVFNGVTTAANYVFADNLARDTLIYQIRFSVANAVPEPTAAALALLAFGAAGLSHRRRVCARSVSPRRET